MADVADLKKLLIELRASAEAQQWERVAELDSHVVSMVDAACRSAPNPELTNTSDLHNVMAELLSLYAFMLDQCTLRQQSLQAEMSTLSRGEQGVKAYHQGLMS